jgi:hypothetical protein
MENLSLPEVVEKKYQFAGSQESTLLAWLEGCLSPDPLYPFGLISSLYYDTPDLKLYGETRNNHYARTKVRLRWYGCLEGKASEDKVCCYLEVKQKFGSTRRKGRIPVEVSVRQLSLNPFLDPTLLSLGNRAREFTPLPAHSLVPMLLIQYERRRFVDPLAGCRASLDTKIRCVRTNPTFVPGLPSVELTPGVLEVKGQNADLLASLEPISSLLTDRGFSKYVQCLRRLMHPVERFLSNA